MYVEICSVRPKTRNSREICSVRPRKRNSREISTLLGGIPGLFQVIDPKFTAPNTDTAQQQPTTVRATQTTARHEHTQAECNPAVVPPASRPPCAAPPVSPSERAARAPSPWFQLSYHRAAPSLSVVLRPPRCSCWCSGWRPQSGPHHWRRRSGQHAVLLRLRRR